LRFDLQSEEPILSAANLFMAIVEAQIFAHQFARAGGSI
jgi:hypothetical protein